VPCKAARGESSSLSSTHDAARTLCQARSTALEAYLAQAGWAEPKEGVFIGAYLPSEAGTSLLEATAQEVGVRLSDGRASVPDESGSAFVRLPLSALSPEDIREGTERLGPVGRHVDSIGKRGSGGHDDSVSTTHQFRRQASTSLPDSRAGGIRTHTRVTPERILSP
jgi:hypothetical protein